MQSSTRTDLHRGAVVRKLATIGEAAGRLPDELRRRYSTIPWEKIIAFRNILVHAYFGIQWDIVWRAATEEVPALRKQIAAILWAEFDEKL